MIWFHSYRYKCDFEYFRICLRDWPFTFSLKRGWEGKLCYGFFPKNILMLNFQEKTIFASKMQGKKYSDTRFSSIKIAIFFYCRVKTIAPPPFQIKRSLRYSFSLLYFFYLGMDKMVFSVATVKLLLGFIGWNLYHYMWSSVNCRHNVRHIRTISFLLPPDWDGLPLNFTITHFQ